MSMPCTPEKQFPGAWPESPYPPTYPNPPTRPSSAVMDVRVTVPGESLEEFHRITSTSCVGGGATQSTKKPPPLRIVIPPSEYCPFSTDLTLPSTPLSLPTPVSSSCFTFSDREELVRQRMSAPPTPAPLPTPCPQLTTVADFASPTSSQFLLMPPTPRSENVENEMAICVSPLTTPGATNEPMRSPGVKFENLRPWEVSSSTWLSDLGGHTETDRIFRHNLLEIGFLDTESSPASTPALSLSALSPSSQVSSSLAYNSPTPVAASSPPSLPPALSPYPCNMSSHICSPARLILKPTGTETFPSTLDSLQAWCENVAPGIPQSEDPRSPFSEDSGISDSQLDEPTPETTSYPSHQLHSHLFSPRVSRTSKSQTFIKHAKMFGGRVKRLVTLRSVNKHRGSMDRGVNFRVVTNEDSENGSVILITAPPPSYDSRPPTCVSHNVGEEHMRSRTVSEFSSAIQTSAAELESGSRQNNSNRHALRRLSFAALSTMKRF